MRSRSSNRLERLMDRSFLGALVLGAVVLCLGSSMAAPAVGAFRAPGTPAAVDAQAVDLPLDSGALLWAGQQTSFDGSAVVPDVGNASADERTFRVRTVVGGDRAGTLVREFVVDTDGDRLLDTAGLEGSYVILYQGQPIYVQDGVGYTSSPPDGTTVSVENSRWEVARQTISAAWADDQVFRNQVVDLVVESNRATFLVTVSADGLGFDDLVTMFDAAAFADDYDARADDDVLVLDLDGETALPVTFAEVPNGEYVLRLAVTDSTARTTTRIRVGRPPQPTATATPALEVTATSGPSTPTESTPPSERTASPEPTVPTASPEPPRTTRPFGTATTSPGQSGFGVGLTLVGLAFGLLGALRRSPR